MRRFAFVIVLVLGSATAPCLRAQKAAGSNAEISRQLEALRRQLETQSYAIEQLQKKVDDVLWFERVADVAEVHAAKLRVPLLVHTTTNDRDVNVLEVGELIAALQAAGKTFEYKVYEDAPGGHSFDRMDSALAHESRSEVYRFLAKHLGA